MALRNSTIITVLLLVICLPCMAGMWMASPGKGSHAAGGGGQSFSDAFTGTNGAALSGSWTVAAGSVNNGGNIASVNTTSYNPNVAAVTAMTTNTAKQYVKATLFTASASCYANLFLRYSASGSPMYMIAFWISEDKVTWARKASASDAAYVTVGSSGGNGTFTVTAGDIYGATLDGTGTSTVIRIWRNPPTNTPTSATDWGGDTTPDLTFTDDPASPVDTGTTCGIGGEINGAGGVQWDDFFAGDCP